MSDTVRLVVEFGILPIAVAIVVWAVTQRRNDRAAVAKLTAETTAAAAAGRVSEGTVHAAIELADVGTLQAHVAAMGAAFREERESLIRRLDEADEKLSETRKELARAHEVIEDLRADQGRVHREMIDMYRRDQHTAQAFHDLSTWLATYLPRMRENLPDIPPPPPMQPLPPLLIGEVQDASLPHRRWYDDDIGQPG